MKNLTVRKLFSALLASFALSLLLVGTMQGTALAASFREPRTTKRSAEEIAAKAQDLGIVYAEGDEPVYDVEPVLGTNYTSGKISQATLDQATDILNLYRFVAGVQDVPHRSDLDEEAQMGSLVNAANGTISHSPDRVGWMSDADWRMGSNACGESNLGMGNSTFGKFVNGCVDDGDPSNIDRVGHRRWFLNPAMTAVGWGCVPMEGWHAGYYAAHVFSFDWNAVDRADMCWPAQTQPLELWTEGSPWSVSIGGASLNSGAITVTLERADDGKVWTFSQGDQSDGPIYFSGSGYGGSPAIIFDPVDLYAHAGDSFTVTVEGVANPLRYTVDFVDIRGLYGDKPDDIYRVFNPKTGEHLFSADANEVRYLVGNDWSSEGSDKTPRYSGIPVYRLTDPWTGKHLYTKDRNEYLFLSTKNGWQGEGIMFYSEGDSGIPVHRLYNPAMPPISQHHYSTDTEREIPYLVSNGWVDEGVVWHYAY